MWIEIVGIVATLCILFSMCFKTLTFKGSVIMRVTNLIGSVIFVVYGCLLPAISTAILNGILIFVNSYHLFVLIKEHKMEEIKMEDVKNLNQEQNTIDAKAENNESNENK